MISETYILNQPYISRLTSDDYRYVHVYLKQERSLFETDTIVLFAIWLLMPVTRFFQHVSFSKEIFDYCITLLILLPIVVLAAWYIYRSRISLVQEELKKDAKTVISTIVESIEIDKYNSVVLYTNYAKHRVFKLGNVIGKIKVNKPITISYLEGCGQVIDYDQ